MKNLFYILLIITAISSCKPPEIGYISDDIHALEDTIFVPKGLFKLSAAPAAEGSTYPLEWEILRVRDQNGNVVTDLQDEYEITTWTSAFNGDTDTTLALAQAKLEQTKNPSILMSKVSGEMAFTQATRFVDRNVFHVDVNVKNVKGERQLNDYVVVKLEPFKAVEFPTEMRSRINFLKNGGGQDIGHTSVISNNFDNGIPSVLDGTHPYITVTQVSKEPAIGINVKMIIADSYGKELDPNKVIFYPSGATYLQNYHDNSVETVSDSKGTTFSLPAPPFPQYGRSYSGTSSYLMYYLSTTDAFTIDKEAYEADKGPKDWSKYEDPDTGEVMNSAYIRWGIKINSPGTWEIKMKIPYTKIKE